MRQSTRPVRNRLSLLFCILFICGPVLAQSRCFICNSQKGIRQIKIGKESREICQECRASKEKCDACHRPSPTTIQTDGRNICASCQRNRIFTQEELDSLYDGVKRFLANDESGVMVDFNLPVKLADKDEIQTKLNESGRAVLALGFYSAYNPEQIYILSGEEKTDSAATLVHEYTHAWQSRNCPSQDRALKEGFACWIEYRYLVSIGKRSMAQNLTRHQDPDYGASLVKLLELEKKLGVKGLVNYVKTERDLPK
jgi:hypothetical protein